MANIYWSSFKNLNFNAGIQYEIYKTWNSQNLAEASVAYNCPFHWSSAVATQADQWNKANELFNFFRSLNLKTTIAWSLSGDHTIESPVNRTPVNLMDYRIFNPSEDYMALKWETYSDNIQMFNFLRKSTREKIIKYLLTKVQEYNLDAIGFDNIYYRAAYPSSWNATLRNDYDKSWLDFIYNLFTRLSRIGRKLICNVSTGTEYWLDLKDIVSGLLYELPFSDSQQQNITVFQNELDAYKSFLNYNKFVGLLPVLYQQQGETLQDYQARVLAKTRFVANALMLVREHFHKIAIWIPFNDPDIYDYYTLPTTYGTPVTGYTKIGNTFRRLFSNGILEVYPLTRTYSWSAY